MSGTLIMPLTPPELTLSPSSFVDKGNNVLSDKVDELSVLVRLYRFCDIHPARRLSDGSKYASRNYLQTLELRCRRF